MVTTRFTARRSVPELVAPARATPRETKAMSDVDNQPSVRFFTPIIEFFCPRRRHADADDVDPAKRIKAALAEALVYYYPVAGRLRLLTDGRDRMVLDCTGEGVVFVEAVADVRLADLGDPLVPPYPCVDELMCVDVVGDTRDVVGRPLLFMQVTRFACGGFAVVITMCHAISDAFGMFQLLGAVVDLARGESTPAVLPVWDRHLLTCTTPPAHADDRPHNLATPCAAAGDEDDDVMLTTPPGEMVIRSFLFGAKELAAMRSTIVPDGLRRSTTAFELLAAVMWRCWTAALEYAPDKTVHLTFTSNSRGRWKRDPPLPRGYYGAALFFPTAAATAGELCGRPLSHAVALVRAAKLTMNDGYVRSELESMARCEHHADVRREYKVSDITRTGDDALDFGWAERVGGGVPMAGDVMAWVPSYFMRCKGTDGEERVVVPMCLPAPAMERFAAQVAAVTTKVFAWSSL